MNRFSSPITGTFCTPLHFPITTSGHQPWLPQSPRTLQPASQMGKQPHGAPCQEMPCAQQQISELALETDLTSFWTVTVLTPKLNRVQQCVTRIPPCARFHCVSLCFSYPEETRPLHTKRLLGERCHGQP